MRCAARTASQRRYFDRHHAGFFIPVWNIKTTLQMLGIAFQTSLGLETINLLFGDIRPDIALPAFLEHTLIR